MAIEFRPLRAEEVECRIGQIAKNGSGLSLLLFKTARTDMDILDETVGPDNWQCKFYEQKGTLFCSTGIRIKREDGSYEWVWKDDAGSPSNMEAAKGEASDCRKRSGVCWGIGRELYTAPRIWIYAQNRDGSANCNIKQGQNGKYQCYDEFSVERIDIRNHEIIYVSVRNDSTGRVVYTWAKQEYQAEPQTNNQPANAPTREMLEEMSGLVAELAKARNVDNDTVLKGVLGSKAAKDSGISNGEVKTSRQAMAVIGQLKAWLRKG
jgi:hypothetical protein